MKFRIKVLGLCALIVASMAVVASSAQGAVRWLILESVGGNILAAGGNYETEAEGPAPPRLNSRIAGVSVSFECTTMATINAKPVEGGKIAEGAQVKFSGCITKLNGTTSIPCEPKAGGKEKGVIITSKGHAVGTEIENAKKEKVPALRVLPDTGETLATIEMSEECSIGEKVPVIGVLDNVDCMNDLPTHLLTHLLQPAANPASKLWVISKTAEHEATVVGSWFGKIRLEGILKQWGLHGA